MPNSFRVSAVVTAFQCEAFLGEALESVFGQSLPPEEVLVVDDGSTDRTLEVARTFGDRVRIVSRPNGGCGAARNAGVAEARGEWIAFLDGDDAWTAGKTRLQLETAERHPEVDLVFGHAGNLVAPPGTTLESARLRGDLTPMPGLVAGAMLARREVLVAVGPFPEDLKLGEFLDWYLRALEAGIEGLLLPDVVLLRRIHGANQSVKERASSGDYVRVLKAALDRRRGASAAADSP